jgi:hypothetical protein
MLSSVDDMAAKGQTADSEDWERYARSLGIAELCPLNFKSSVAHESLFPHLAPNMLPFTVAISPNEQDSRDSSLFLYVLCNALLILLHFQSMSHPLTHVHPRRQYYR